MDILTTMLALGGVFLWHIWRVAAEHRREQNRRHMRGGVRPWWGQR